MGALVVAYALVSCASSNPWTSDAALCYVAALNFEWRLVTSEHRHAAEVTDVLQAVTRGQHELAAEAAAGWTVGNSQTMPVRQLLERTINWTIDDAYALIPLTNQVGGPAIPSDDPAARCAPETAVAPPPCAADATDAVKQAAAFIDGFMVLVERGDRPRYTAAVVDAIRNGNSAIAAAQADCVAR